MGITADQTILDSVQHCNLEIGNRNQARPGPEIHFGSTEKELINSEIKHLREISFIEARPTVHSPDEYISTIFVRRKKSGKYHTILNPKAILRNIISIWIPFGLL